MGAGGAQAELAHFLLRIGGVKKFIESFGEGQSEFISSNLAPVHDKHDCEFSLRDFMLFLGSVVGLIAIVRFLVGL